MEMSNRKSCGKRNWSDLCEDLLIVIAEKLKHINDIIAFYSVCVSWRSAASKEIGFINKQARRLPWLLLTTGESHNAVKNQMLFPFGNGKLYDTDMITNPFYKHPCIKRRRFTLGWKGWVLGHESIDTIYLTHAFANKTKIMLPSLRSLRRGTSVIDVPKALLSSDPFTSPSDFVLVMIYRGYSCISKAVFWRLGDESYNKINVAGFISEVIFHQGLLYVLTWPRITVVDITWTNLTIIKREMVIPREYRMYSTVHFVEIGGVLVNFVQIQSRIQGKIHTSFRAFTFTTELGHCSDITDLGNRAIFLGSNQPFVLDNASAIPGCSPNSIYFTEDYEFIWHNKFEYSYISIHPMNAGVFNLITNTVVGYPHCCRLKDETYSSRLWIQPTFG